MSFILADCLCYLRTKGMPLQRGFYLCFPCMLICFCPFSTARYSNPHTRLEITTSGLQATLHYPHIPGESTLPFLFTYGIAGESFQKQNFQYLNIHDVFNLRQANSRLNDVLQGRPTIINHYDDQRVLLLQVPTNSVKQALKARCFGRNFTHYPENVPCNVDPLTDLRVRYRTGVPQPLDHNRRIPAYLLCCTSVCDPCVQFMAKRLRRKEQDLLRDSRRVILCVQCQRKEMRAHPAGFTSCICRSLIYDGTKCWTCRWTTFWQLRERYHCAVRTLLDVHKDQWGRVIVDSSRPQRSTIPCPGCAGFHCESGGPVRYCLGCNGILVQSSIGQNITPTPVVPVQPTRRSLRVAANAARQPSVGLDCLRH